MTNDGAASFKSWELGPVLRRLGDALQEVSDIMHSLNDCHDGYLMSLPWFEPVESESAEWGLDEWFGVEVYLKTGSDCCKELERLFVTVGALRLEQLRRP